KVTHEDDFKKSDIVIINTCGFINDSKQESIDTILKCVELKNANKIKKILVTGCLSERYKDELIKEIPEVDHFTGVNQLKEILKHVGAEIREEIIEQRTLTTPSHYAYLKISEGCNRKCSFCAIPQIRGKYKSRTIESIIKEADFLSDKGVKELILIAQDTTYYGLDLYKKHELNNLLQNLEKIDKLKWIRLHYAYPAGFPTDILDTINNSEKICKYIDIPFQHISDHILSSMNRCFNSTDTYKLIDTIREKIPGITIRTTLITGYPGETQNDFNKLKDFVKNIEFERLGIFAYSHEENTTAYNLNDDVPENIKLDRVEEIMNIQQEISLKHNQNLVGKTIKVIVDREENDFFIGRTQADSPDIDNEVLISKDHYNINPGDFTDILVNSADYFDISGEIHSLNI
ncbi:MAG: 30S ribosomal protein S12 methylthiotransferase RimO, partial [Bacteroidota bacterium]|nr:30S ribosomal protein S12 methylthiotransferase RimO [Bacteroidota bacterium]